MGLAGAFTALADDATAASWNPAGLIQLERPEASAVFRYSWEKDDHHSGDEPFRVGEDGFKSENLNYFSLVYPFHVRSLKRNFVLSLNYQEAYDFTQHFTVNLRENTTSSTSETASETFTGTEIHRIQDGTADITATFHKTTEAKTAFEQLLTSELISDLDFDQKGIISAISPALALEITPRLSLGVALNYYYIDPLSEDTIRSKTFATYSGHSDSFVDITTRRTTTGTFEYEGVIELSNGSLLPIEGEGVFEPRSNIEKSDQKKAIEVDGVFEEVNTFNNLHGFNTTLGCLWTVSDHLTLGASVDLPWRAEAEQKKTIRNEVTTFSASRTKILDVTEDEIFEKKDVEFEFQCPRKKIFKQKDAKSAKKEIV